MCKLSFVPVGNLVSETTPSISTLHTKNPIYHLLCECGAQYDKTDRPLGILVSEYRKNIQLDLKISGTCLGQTA